MRLLRLVPDSGDGVTDLPGGGEHVYAQSYSLCLRLRSHVSLREGERERERENGTEGEKLDFRSLLMASEQVAETRKRQKCAQTDIVGTLQYLVAEQGDPDHRHRVPDRLERAVDAEVGEEEDRLGVGQDLLLREPRADQNVVGTVGGFLLYSNIV